MTQQESLKPYKPDYDWFWGGKPGNDGTQATLRMTVRGDMRAAGRAVDVWLAGLSTDNRGVRGEGGWRVDEVSRDEEAIVLDITSGGEDVADGVLYGAESAFEAIAGVPHITVAWKQLPRKDRYVSSDR